jgi:hypothetical protein
MWCALSLRALEQRHVERLLRQVRGWVAVVAQQPGIPRSSLDQKLK